MLCESITDATFGEAVLYCISLLVAFGLVWFGKKRKLLVLTIPCALIFLFMAMAVIPSIVPARSTGHRNACVYNLRQIHDAKIEWALVNHKPPTDVPAEADLCGTNGTNGFLRHKLVCPDDGQYTFGAVNEAPKCSLAAHGHKLP